MPRVSKNSDLRSKLGDLECSVMGVLPEIEAKLRELNEEIYDIEESEARFRIQEIINVVKPKAGPAKSKQPGFPAANDARSAIYKLESWISTV